MGKRKVWLASLVKSVFPGIAAGLGIAFWNRPRPASVRNYWVIYCLIAVLSAIGMWYLPYFRGAKEAQKKEYLAMDTGTKHVLPERGDNPRPNAFHLGNLLFLANLCLALALLFGG